MVYIIPFILWIESYKVFSSIPSTTDPSQLLQTILMNIANNLRFYIHSQNIYCQQYVLSILLSIFIQFSKREPTEAQEDPTKSLLNQVIVKIYPLLVPLFKEKNLKLFVPLYKLLFLCIRVNFSTYKHKYIEEIWPIVHQLLDQLYHEIQSNHYSFFVNPSVALSIYKAICEGIYKYDQQLVYLSIENELVSILFRFSLLNYTEIHHETLLSLKHMYQYYPDCFYAFIHQQQLVLEDKEGNQEKQHQCVDAQSTNQQFSSSPNLSLTTQNKQTLSSLISSILYSE